MTSSLFSRDLFARAFARLSICAFAGLCVPGCSPETQPVGDSERLRMVYDRSVAPVGAPGAVTPPSVPIPDVPSPSPAALPSSEDPLAPGVVPDPGQPPGVVPDPGPVPDLKTPSRGDVASPEPVPPRPSLERPTPPKPPRPPTNRADPRAQPSPPQPPQQDSDPASQARARASNLFAAGKPCDAARVLESSRADARSREMYEFMQKACRTP